MTQSGDIGDHGEALAREYLERQGWQFITANWHCKLGEIDLIMDDPHHGERVFVEVRVRQQTHYGSAADTVTWQKQQKLIRTAQLYLQQVRYEGPARFDVVAIAIERGKSQAATQHTIDHIRDAFIVSVSI